MTLVLGILGLAMAAWFGVGHGRFQAYSSVTYQSETSRMGPLSLRDGSVFQLNSRSRLRVNFTESTRGIVLDSGEVFFDVSHDAVRPFDVQAGVVKLSAKGTAFSVKKRDDGAIETTVRQGTVEVVVPRRPRLYRGAPEEVSEGKAAADDSQRVGDTKAVREAKTVGRPVQAGEVATIGADGQMNVTEVGQADLVKRLAWADPIQDLDGMTLQEAVELYNRYNVRKLEIADPDLGKRPVTGRYHLTEPDRFVEALESHGIRHQTQGPGSDANARILLTRK